MDDEPFVLIREPDSRPRKVEFENQPARQTALLSGLDCLPAQQDLLADLDKRD